MELIQKNEVTYDINKISLDGIEPEEIQHIIDTIQAISDEEGYSYFLKNTENLIQFGLFYSCIVVDKDYNIQMYCDLATPYNENSLVANDFGMSDRCRVRRCNKMVPIKSSKIFDIITQLDLNKCVSSDDLLMFTYRPKRKYLEVNKVNEEELCIDFRGLHGNLLVDTYIKRKFPIYGIAG